MSSAEKLKSSASNRLSMESSSSQLSTKSETKELKQRSKVFFGKTVDLFKELKEENQQERNRSNSVSNASTKPFTKSHFRSKSDLLTLKSTKTAHQRAQSTDLTVEKTLLRNSDSTNVSVSSERSVGARSQVMDSGRLVLNSTQHLVITALKSEHGQEFIGHAYLLVEEIISDLKLDDLWGSVKVLWTQFLSNEEAVWIIVKETSQVRSVWTKERVKKFKERGKELIKRGTTSGSETVSREELISFLKEGLSMMKEIKGENFNPLELIKDGKVLLRALLTSKDSKNTVSQGFVVLKSLKEKHPEIFAILLESENLAKEIRKNEDVKGLIKQGQSLVTGMIDNGTGQLKIDKEATALLFKNGVNVALHNKESRKFAKDALTNGKDLVERLSQEEHIHAMLLNGKNMFKDMKKSGELRELLKANVQFVTDLADTAIPFVRDQLLAMHIPSLGGTKPLSVGGKLTFELSNIVLSGLTIPVKGIKIDFTDSILIQVVNIGAEIKGMKWSYSQSGFPYLKDSGTGGCTVKNAEGKISFKIEFSKEGQPYLAVSDAEFKIGSLDINVGATTASFIYNVLLSLFSSVIKNQVESEISKLINKHVGKLTTKINKLAAKYWPKIFSDKNKKKYLSVDPKQNPQSNRSSVESQQKDKTSPSTQINPRNSQNETKQDSEITNKRDQVITTKQVEVTTSNRDQQVEVVTTVVVEKEEMIVWTEEPPQQQEPKTKSKSNQKEKKEKKTKSKGRSDTEREKHGKKSKKQHKSSSRSSKHEKKNEASSSGADQPTLANNQQFKTNDRSSLVTAPSTGESSPELFRSLSNTPVTTDQTEELNSTPKRTLFESARSSQSKDSKEEIQLKKSRSFIFHSSEASGEQEDEDSYRSEDF